MSFPLTRGGRNALKAFTLIELLTVIAIIGILAAITFGVFKGAQERAAIGQARSELGAIATALDAYKRQYGDYPQIGPFGAATPPTALSDTNNPGYLFNALAGKLGPKRNQIAGKSFLDLAQFTWSNPAAAPALTGTTQVANALLDPWGVPYLYAYREPAPTGPGPWVNPSFVLLSAGPDGRVNIPNTGMIDKNHVDNLDNVYPN